MNIEALDNLEIGTSMDWKFGLVTRDVLKVKKDIFVISDCSSGWHEARINRETLLKVVNGEISLLDLNWK